MPVTNFEPSKERAAQIIKSASFQRFYKDALAKDPAGSPGGAARWAFIKHQGWDYGRYTWKDRYSVPKLSNSRKNTLNFVQSQFASGFDPLEISDVTSGDVLNWSGEAIAENTKILRNIFSFFGRNFIIITALGAVIYLIPKGIKYAKTAKVSKV